MLLLFWIGSFWREDDQPEPVSAHQPMAAPAGPARPLLPVALGVLVVAGLWPAYAAWLTARPLPPMPELQVETQGGWQPADAFTGWVPHWIGADRQLRQSYSQAGRVVMLELNYYATQRQGAELVNSQNFMIRQKDLDWSNVGEHIATVEIGCETRQVRQAKMRGSNSQRLLVWQWNLIGSRATVNDPVAKLILAIDRVQLKRDDGVSVLIATPYDETELEAAAATLARFAADMEPAIAGALDRVDGP
jgi:EpsI family protein